MQLVEPVGGVALDAVDEGAAKDVGCDAIEDDVAKSIRLEVHTVVTGKVGKLRVVLQC